MNMVPFIAYNMSRRRRSSASSSTSCELDGGSIFVMAMVIVVFALLLLFFISNIFADFEVVETTSETVVTVTMEPGRRHDDFFVTLSDGNTYEISKNLYSSLMVGEVVEFSQIVKHTFLGDIPGYEISGEFHAYN